MAKRAGHNPRDSRKFYEWIERAYEDLASAKLLKSDERCYNACAFHCQQCIEKALKAYILMNSKKLVDGHNLTWLCRQVVRFNSGFSQWLDESAALNSYYIETRYPSDFDEALEKQEIDNTYRMARDMYTCICNEIYNDQEESADGSIDTVPVQ